MGTWNRLRAREAEQGCEPIAIIGAGYVGTGVVHAVHQSPGMRPAIVVNRHAERALAAYAALGIHDVVVSDDPATLADAIDGERACTTSHAAVLTELPVSVVVEATGALDYGTETILATLRSGRHVVSFNAECDALLAWRFHQVAREAGAIYTIADGDQPGVLFRLGQELDSMGFEPTAFLNCKRHLDVHQNPATGAGYAARDTTSAHMTTAFGDGTKMQVEQAVVANATGAVPDVRGMHGIASTIASAAVDIPAVLGPIDSGEPPKVDFTLGGDFGAGVGIVARHPHHDLHAKAMGFYKMGPGPDYFFFRPYHLVHLEIPLTIAEVILDAEPLVTVDGPHVAEVIAMAKKDLGAGETLDGIGGFCAYGHIDTVANARGFLPVGLVDYATMTAPTAIDEPIALDSVELDTDTTVVAEWAAMHDLSL